MIMNDEYHPHYEGFGWPDGRPMPKKKKFKARRRLIKLLLIQKCKCFYCQEDITPLNANIDHVVPVSKGGTNIHTNLVASCVRCNDEKGNSHPTQQQVTRAREQWYD